MKEASGEVSMTLIVIVLAGVLITLFITLKPQIQGYLNNMWGNFDKKASCELNGTC